MEEELVVKDVNPDNFKACDVGVDAFNLYVIAPARFVHAYEGSLDLTAAVCYCDSQDAENAARRHARANKISYCVYRLEACIKFNVKGDAAGEVMR